MLQKKLEQIELSDLERLLSVAREGKTLEFKQVMAAKSDREVIQFLAAVSAFANSTGGDLLIGIAADEGIAQSISGVPLAGFDDEKLRLEQLLADNIEPRLPVVGFHSVPCGDGNHVIVVRVQRSWLAPHRVLKNDKFYGRNSAGKYPLDVGELRNAFVLREAVSERIRAFRAQTDLRRLLRATRPVSFVEARAWYFMSYPYLHLEIAGLSTSPKNYRPARSLCRCRSAAKARAMASTSMGSFSIRGLR
ncbi:hypothetical protein ABH994_001311 [Bradyrhizobium yuanmingense]|uniref:AlbA family DNA-binding domain-containing protein n=1 Tax=Bradyrhizobium yuanmingense TaxID=108015 RepID=UPI003519AC34